MRNRTFSDYDQPGQQRPAIGSSADLFYPQMTSFDLREEFEWMLMGNFENPGIGRPVIYRKLSNTHCVCWNGLTGSPDPNCTYCFGEGYQFTETILITYIARNFGSVLGGATQINQQSQLSQAGYFDGNKAIAYLSYYTIPDYERYTSLSRPATDKLYELKVDDDGLVIQPYIRLDKWHIRSLTAHNGDNGRVEFLEIGIERISV